MIPSKTIYISGIRGNTIGADTYVHYEEQTLTGVVIDPGVGAEKVIEAIDSKKLIYSIFPLTTDISTI